jgi:hypothetical protein
VSDDLFDRFMWAAVWLVGLMAKEASSVATELIPKVAAVLRLE